MKPSTSKNRKLYWIAILVLLIGWETASRWLNQEIILPSLVSVAWELVRILGDSGAWRAIIMTVGRVVLTFVVDLVLALGIGTAAGLMPQVEYAMKPLETTLRAVPTMGIVLLALIWFDADVAPLFVTSLVLFPILYRSTVDGIHNVDADLVEFHVVHRIPLWKRLTRFYIPSMLPFVRTGSIASLGLGFKVMIAAEVLSQPRLAIGTAFQIERARLNTAAVMAWCVVVVIAASAFEMLLKRVGTRALRAEQQS